LSNSNLAKPVFLKGIFNLWFYFKIKICMLSWNFKHFRMGIIQSSMNIMRFNKKR
jgi:hypothetical protein